MPAHRSPARTRACDRGNIRTITGRASRPSELALRSWSAPHVNFSDQSGTFPYDSAPLCVGPPFTA